MQALKRAIFTICCFVLVGCGGIKYQHENTFDQIGCIDDRCHDIKRTSGINTIIELQDGKYRIENYKKVRARGKIKEEKSFLEVEVRGEIFTVYVDSIPVIVNNKTYTVESPKKELQDMFEPIIGTIKEIKNRAWSSGDIAVFDKNFDFGNGNDANLKLRMKFHGIMEIDGIDYLYMTGFRDRGTAMLYAFRV